MVLFCGGGQDSHALLYQYYYDAAFRATYVGDAHFLVVMSDTGDEHADFYETTLPELRAFCAEVGIEFYFITSDMGYHSHAWLSLMHQMKRNDTVMGVAFPKSCTDQLKVQVCYRFLSDWLRHAYGFTSKGYNTFYEYFAYYGKLVSWIGFAADEHKRIKAVVSECGAAEGARPDKAKRKQRISKKTKAPKPADSFSDLFGEPVRKSSTKKANLVPVYRQRCVQHRYPLVDLGLNRADCQRLISNYGHRVPFPTNCQRCPFQGEVEIVYLYRTQPQVWAEWVEREAAKLQKNAHKPVNLGVKGRMTLPQFLERALKNYGHWTVGRLAEYRFSHGHCVMSKI